MAQLLDGVDRHHGPLGDGHVHAEREPVAEEQPGRQAHERVLGDEGDPVGVEIPGRRRPPEPLGLVDQAPAIGVEIRHGLPLSRVGHDDFHVRQRIGEQLPVLVVPVVDRLDRLPVLLEQVHAEDQVGRGAQDADEPDERIHEAQADQGDHEVHPHRDQAVQRQVDQVPDRDPSLAHDVARLARMHLGALRQREAGDALQRFGHDPEVHGPVQVVHLVQLPAVGDPEVQESLQDEEREQEEREPRVPRDERVGQAAVEEGVDRLDGDLQGQEGHDDLEGREERLEDRSGDRRKGPDAVPGAEGGVPDRTPDCPHGSILPWLGTKEHMLQQYIGIVKI